MRILLEMKPLTNEQKENVFDEIVKSIAYIHEPSPGEFTRREVRDSLLEIGCDISMDKIRHRLKKLVEAEILATRVIAVDGSRTIVYSATKEIDYEEMLRILLE